MNWKNENRAEIVLLNMDKLTWPRGAKAVASRTTSLTLKDMTMSYCGKKEMDEGVRWKVKRKMRNRKDVSGLSIQSQDWKST